MLGYSFFPFRRGITPSHFKPWRPPRLFKKGSHVYKLIVNCLISFVIVFQWFQIVPNVSCCLLLVIYSLFIVYSFQKIPPIVYSVQNIPPTVYSFQYIPPIVCVYSCAPSPPTGGHSAYESRFNSQSKIKVNYFKNWNSWRFWKSK